MRLFRFAAFYFAPVLTVFATTEFATALELKGVSLPAQAIDFAIDAVTGNLAAVETNDNKVVLYKGDLKPSDQPLTPIATAVVGNKPVSIVYKKTTGGSFFVVGCVSDAHLYILEPATLKQVAKIPVTSSDVSSVASSSAPDDPYVYYCYGGGHGSSTGRIDVVKRIDQGLAFDDSMDCAISAKGTYAYRRGPWSPSGFESLRVHEGAGPGGKAIFSRLFYDHNSTAQYVPDPFEQFTAAGTRIYTVGLEKQVAELPFAPLAFFADKPVLVGLSGVDRGMRMGPSSQAQKASVALASYNTFAPLGEKQLPADFFAQKDSPSNLSRGGHADFKFVGARPRVFADDARKRIVVANRDRAVAVPLSDFALKDEPFLILQGDTKSPLTVNKPNIVTLATKDARIKVELVDMLENASLTAKGFEWTPNESFIGPNFVRFRLSHGDTERTVSLEINVTREGMTLPFDPDRIAVADDGKSAFVWTSSDGDGFHPRNTNAATPPRGAVLDLVGRKTDASAVLAFPVGRAAVDQHGVYVVQNNSGTVAALDRATLTVKKQIPLEGVVSWLNTVGGKFLVVGMNDGRWIKYSVPDLALVADHPVQNNSFGMRNENTGIGLTNVVGGYRLPTSGDVFDETLSKPILLSAAPGFATALPSQGMPSERVSPFQNLHNGMSMRGDSEKEFTRRLADERAGVYALLARSMKSEQVPGAIHTNRNWETWSVDLVDPGTMALPAKRVITLSKTAMTDAVGSSRPSNTGELAIAADQLFALTRARLYSFPLNELNVVEQGEKPIAFVAKQSTMVVDAAGPTKLTHQVVGGKKPYQFALFNPQGGLQIDSASGDVTVDGPAIVAAALNTHVGTVTGMLRRGNTWQNPESVDGYVMRQSSAFETIAGRKPTGVPVALEINLQATDSTPRTARLRYYVVVDVPRKLVDERMAQITAELAKNREAALIAQQNQQTAQGGVGGNIDAAADARIRKLEERIVSLEAQLNLLIKILGSREAK